MRILQITNSFYPSLGGQEKVVLELSRGLAKEGNEVTILTSNYSLGKNFKRHEKIEGINVVRLRNNYWLRGYGFSKEMKNWLKKNYRNFDVVHCHGYNRYMAEFALKLLNKKVPLVFSPHGFIHTKKNILFKKIHDLIISKVINNANVVTALTKLDFKEYKKIRIPKRKIVEIPNGVDLLKFKERKGKIKEFKKRYDLDGDILLYIGRIHKSKGLIYVVRAIKDLNCKLLIVGGDAGHKKELLVEINKLKLGEKVIFTGRISNEDLISAGFSSDIFVLFSEWEGFGIAAIEGMAASLPVIASDRGALPFLVKDGENGFVVPFRDAAKLRERISFLINSPQKRISMGKNARNESEKYSWGSVVKKTREAYGEAILRWSLKK